MRRHAPTVLSPLMATVATLASPSLAQTVHHVGPGALPQISAAIAVASPGDVIEVQTGAYEPFAVTMPLTIRAAAGATATILPFNSTPVTLAPPAGTVATLQGIQVLNPWGLLWTCNVEVLGGTVFLEDCIFESSNQYLDGAVEVTNATAILTRCTLAGFGATRGAVGAQNDALRATGATIQATDCAFFGSYTTFDSYGLGGNGMTAIASDVHLVRCKLVGGGMFLSFANPGGHGLDAASSRVWVADSHVEGGSTPGLYGHQVGVKNNGPPIQWVRSKIQGGADQNGGRVAAFNGPNTAAPLLGLRAAAPMLARGGTSTVQFHTEANWPIAVFVNPDLAPNRHPALVQPLAVDPAMAGPLAVLMADANGHATYQTTIPNVPVSLAQRLHVTAISGTTLPLQTMPPLGGVVR